MNRLGSDFLKELDSYERPVIGVFTFRQLILFVGIGLTVTITSVLVYMDVSETLNILVMGVILPPFVIFGLKFDERIKDEVRFMFTKQERTYMTEFDREEYKKNAFVPEKGISEADFFNES